MTTDNPIHAELLARLGLRGDGDMFADDHVHNGSWFDQDGARIGWGDLSRVKLFDIASKLRGVEVVWILSEQDAYWDAPKEGITLDYVKAKARIKIEPGRVTRIRNQYVGDTDEKIRFYEPHTSLDSYERTLGYVISR